MGLRRDGESFGRQGHVASASYYQAGFATGITTSREGSVFGESWELLGEVPVTEEGLAAFSTRGNLTTAACSGRI